MVQIVRYKSLRHLGLYMSKEPLFGLYLKSRDDTPDSATETYKDDFVFEKVPADEVIRGWNNVKEFIDQQDEEYYWREAEPETASTTSICGQCDAQVKTHSEERIQDLKSMHHISTGH